MTDKQLAILIAAMLLSTASVADREDPATQLRAWTMAKTIVARANALPFP